MNFSILKKENECFIHSLLCNCNNSILMFRNIHLNFIWACEFKSFSAECYGTLNLCIWLVQTHNLWIDLKKQ